MSFIPFLLLSIGLSSQSFNFGHAIDAATALSLHQVSHDQNTETMQNASRITSDWGTIDTKRWGIYGSYGRDVKNSDNHLMTIGAEFEYFVEEDLSVDLGLLFMDVDQLGGDANGINFTLQLRWHAHKTNNYSFFIEGGAGMLRTSQNVPTGGSKFNFTPQAGLGFSFPMENQKRWLIGLKWHHISNANTYDTNPGRDSWQLWTGFSLPF